MSKFDKFLMSKEFFDVGPGLSAIALDWCFSDHTPILLKSVTSDFGPTPFRFFDVWLKLDGFNELVASSWNQQGTSGVLPLFSKINEVAYQGLEIESFGHRSRQRQCS